MSLVSSSSHPSQLGQDSPASPRSDYVVDGGPDSLTVRVQWRGDHCVVVVAGELDVATAPLLTGALREVLVQGPGNLVVDLDQVGFIDSTGLGVLVAALQRTTAQKVDLVLVCNGLRCLKVFEITGLTRVFTFAPTVEAGISGSERSHQS